MVTDPALAWFLTGLYLLLAAQAVWGIAVARDNSSMLDYVHHLVMCLGMIAMCWPWWQDLPEIPVLAVFCAILVWSVYRLSDADARVWRHRALHVAMAVAMVWMCLVMPPGVATMEALDPWQAITGIIAFVGLAALGAIVTADVWVDKVTAVRSLRVENIAGTAMAVGMVIMCWPMVMH